MKIEGLWNRAYKGDTKNKNVGKQEKDLERDGKKIKSLFQNKE